MAYRRKSYRASRSRYSTRRRAPTRRRRTSRRRSSPQKIVIQVIGGGMGGQVPIAVTAGKKGKRTLRAKY